MKKLIVLLTALMLIAPAISYAGGKGKGPKKPAPTPLFCVVIDNQKFCIFVDY